MFVNKKHKLIFRICIKVRIDNSHIYIYFIVDMLAKENEIYEAKRILIVVVFIHLYFV